MRQDKTVLVLRTNMNIIAAMSIIDAVVNSVLPLTINPSVGIFTDMRFVSYGDIMHFTVKPRSLYVVSEGKHRPAC